MPTRPVQSGFALLLTLVIISVVLAIGLSLLNITVKQFTLSATSRDSELAFHAADAGVECMREASNSIDLFAAAAPGSIDVSCAGEPSQNISDDAPQARVHQYSAQYSWSTDTSSAADTVCTDVDLFILDGQSSDTTFDFDAAGYGIDSQTCEDGNVCTYIFSRGYNRPCDRLDGLRVVQREITVDF